MSRGVEVLSGGVPPPETAQTDGGRGKPLPYDKSRTASVLRRGAPWGSRQDAHQECWLGKVRRSPGIAAILNFANPGPSGPAGIHTSHSDFARRKFCRTHQECVPRNGGPGDSGPMGTKCASAASPGDPLVSFPSLGKKLAARRRRNPPQKREEPKKGCGPHAHQEETDL